MSFFIKNNTNTSIFLKNYFLICRCFLYFNVSSMKNNSETEFRTRVFVKLFLKSLRSLRQSLKVFTLQEHFGRSGTLAGKLAAKRSFAASLFATEKGSINYKFLSNSRYFIEFFLYIILLFRYNRHFRRYFIFFIKFILFFVVGDKICSQCYGIICLVMLL